MIVFEKKNTMYKKAKLIKYRGYRIHKDKVLFTYVNQRMSFKYRENLFIGLLVIYLFKHNSE